MTARLQPFPGGIAIVPAAAGTVLLEPLWDDGKVEFVEVMVVAWAVVAGKPYPITLEGVREDALAVSQVGSPNSEVPYEGPLPRVELAKMLEAQRGRTCLSAA